MSDVIRELGITEAFVFLCNKQYAGLDVVELRERKSLREENAKLRQVVVDLVFDETILKDALGKMALNEIPGNAARILRKN